MNSQPLIVLVHGAITDASVWSLVAGRLQSQGYTTIAPALPLRSLHADAEYLSSILATLEGPFVLVGHSYGGSVISKCLGEVYKTLGVGPISIRASIISTRPSVYSNLESSPPE